MKSKILLILALASFSASVTAGELETDRFGTTGLNPNGDFVLFSSSGWPGGIQHRSIATGNVLFRSFRPPNYPITEPTNKLTVNLWLNLNTFTNSDELLFWAENVNPTNARTFWINANDTEGTVSVYLISQAGTNGGFFTRPSSGTNHFAIMMDRTTGTNCGVQVYTNGVMAPFTQTHGANMDSSNFESDNLLFLSRGEPDRYAVEGVLAAFKLHYGQADAQTLFALGLPRQPLPKRNWFGEIVP